jgi:hypothetical protein
MGSRVELYAAIRFDWQRNQRSIRALADKYGVHRRTVREAVESPIPPPRKNAPRSAPVLEAVREVIDAMLAEDVAAPRGGTPAAVRPPCALSDRCRSRTVPGSDPASTREDRVGLGVWMARAGDRVADAAPQLVRLEYGEFLDKACRLKLSARRGDGLVRTWPLRTRPARRS